jgi:transposase
MGGIFMAGKKGMKRFGEAIIDEVLLMYEEGKSYRQIAEHFGFENTKIIKNLLWRFNKKQRQLEVGMLPLPKGRPKKVVIEQDYKDARIQQLEMENELLRAFLSEIERG